MKTEEVMTLLTEVICDVVEGDIEVVDDLRLIGGDSRIDSMKLVEICLALEDIAEELGFDFDWTSEAAMSKSRSMFRDVSALAREFSEQSGG